ncbi:hypothetical protein K7G98_35680, partial [Saccharothrix sp. MB29]|nr:hypothetical protein [Saccharothrix sp. MB29]
MPAIHDELIESHVLIMRDPEAVRHVDERSPDRLPPVGGTSIARVRCGLTAHRAVVTASDLVP